MQRLIATLALALVSIAQPASTRAEERYMDGLDLNIDRVKKRVDQIEALRSAAPERFDFVAPYLTLVDVLQNERKFYTPLGPQCSVRPLDKPEFFDPRHAELVAKHPQVVTDVRAAMERGSTWGGGGLLPAHSQTQWTGELSDIQAKYGLSDDDFADLLNGMDDRYPSGFDGFQGPPRARPRLNKDHQLVWEEALILRSAPDIRSWVLLRVVSYHDPASTPILGEIARLYVRDQRGGATPFSYAALGILWFPGRESLIELSDILRLVPGERRDVAREWLGEVIAESAVISPKLLISWTDYLSEAEKDPDLRDHVARLRDSVEFYKQKKAEREKK